MLKGKGSRIFFEFNNELPEGSYKLIQIIDKIIEKKNGKYKNLLKCIANEDILFNLFERILNKEGHYSKNNEKYILLNVDIDFFKKLSKEIGSGVYKSSPSRKVFVSKNDGSGKLFKISISVDKLVHESIVASLKYVYEPIFLDCSYGFKTNKGIYMALNKYKLNFSCVSWVINIDIKNYFDSIDFIVLAQFLIKIIDDRGFMDLYWKIIKAGYTFEKCFSLILSNIYLHEFDISMVKLKKIYGENGLKIYYIRYMDEFIIGIDGSKLDAVEILDIIKVEFLMNKLKLKPKLNQVVNFKINKIKFLGYYLKGVCNKNSKPLILVPRIEILEKLLQKNFVKRGVGSNYKATFLGKCIHYSLYNIIKYYNFIYRVIWEYYNICFDWYFLKNIHRILKESCALTIALKMRLKTISKVIKIYGKNLIVLEKNGKISFIKFRKTFIIPKMNHLLNI